MATCPSCGVENKDSVRFCFNCGAAIPAPPAAPAPPPAPPKAAHARRARPPEPLGLAGFALFLVIVGIVFSANPGMFNQFLDWVVAWTTQGGPIRPPEALIGSAVLFFGLTGVTSFAMAALRLAVTGLWVRAIGDVMSGVAMLALSYLLSLYQRFELTAAAVLGLLAVVAGVLIFLYVAIGLAWGFGRRFAAREERPVARR